MKLPIATKDLLKPVSCDQSALLKGVARMLQTLIVKLQERSPLKYLVIRCASALSTENMLHYKESYILKFEKLVDKLFERNRITAQQADGAKVELKDQDKFAQYNFNNARWMNSSFFT